MSQTLTHKLLSKRPAFILVGLVNISIFTYAIYRLWHFLLYMDNGQNSHFDAHSLLVNLLLVTFFSIPHSLLLNTKVKASILRYVPQGLYYSLYSLHASVAIILMDKYWQGFGVNIYSLDGLPKNIALVLYAGSWIFMFWAMWTVGLGKQNGVEDWIRTLKKQKLKHRLSFHGPFTITRQPIYISFLGMLWTTPNMSLSHLLLSALWTSYIVYGIAKKEARLAKNSQYRTYTQLTPILPFWSVSLENYLLTQARKLL